MPLRIDHIPEDNSGSVATIGAADMDERRLHARNLKVMRVARVAAPDLHTEGLGMVRDVSPGGMMIDAHFDLDIGQSVSIALLDDQELTGMVAWKEGSMIGIRFTDELSVEQILAKPVIKGDGQRVRLPRFNVQKAVQLKLEKLTVDAVLYDVSQRGAKLRCEGKLRVHSNLLVRAEGHRPVAGSVKWRAGDVLGVEFHRLLSVEELDQWIKI